MGAPGDTVAGSAHSAVSAAGVNSLPGTISGIGSLFLGQSNNNSSNTQVPKAYINYLIFDEQFKCVGSNFSPVGANSTLKDHHPDLSNIVVPKNVYIYIYCSNESPVDVFFDNLQVVHTRGPVLEETHYYPFGLAMAGISSRAAGSLVNKYQ